MLLRDRLFVPIFLSRYGRLAASDLPLLDLKLIHPPGGEVDRVPSSPLPVCLLRSTYRGVSAAACRTHYLCLRHIQAPEIA